MKMLRGLIKNFRRFKMKKQY